MITRLMWTIWTVLSAVPRKAVKFNHSLTHSLMFVGSLKWCQTNLLPLWMHFIIKYTSYDNMIQTSLQGSVQGISWWFYCWVSYLHRGIPQGVILLPMLFLPIMAAFQSACHMWYVNTLHQYYNPSGNFNSVRASDTYICINEMAQHWFR